MVKPVYLRCLDVEKNHYKYYKMQPLNDSMFVAEYGREGAKPQRKEYPMSKWNEIYRQKIKKGYVDKSEHFVLEKTVASGEKQYKELANAEIRELVEKLMAISKTVVSNNYNISVKHVTQKMIDEAQYYIDALSKCYTNGYGVSEYNEILLKLLNTVPRKIPNVNKVLCPDGNGNYIREYMRKQIEFEESLLDNMRACVASDVVTLEQGVDVVEQTILEALGIEIEPCTDDDMKKINDCFRGRDTDIKNKMITAFKVTNKRTEKAYKDFKHKYRDDYKRFPSKLLWHGSRNENWWAIINSGLKIRPSGAVYTGSMFGDGLYFANSALKSYGYTSSRGAYWVHGNSDIVFMSLFEVGVGNQLHTDNNHGDFCRMTWAKLRGVKDSDGKLYHSVYAHQGAQLRNDELIMYNPSQVTIRYLVMFKG